MTDPPAVCTVKCMAATQNCPAGCVCGLEPICPPCDTTPPTCPECLAAYRYSIARMTVTREDPDQ